MAINLPLSLNVQAQTAKALGAPLDLKLNQVVDATVIDAKTETNTLALQIGDKTLTVQTQPPLPAASGQTLQLQVVRLQPPEFRLVPDSALPNRSPTPKAGAAAAPLVIKLIGLATSAPPASTGDASATPASSSAASSTSASPNALPGNNPLPNGRVDDKTAAFTAAAVANRSASSAAAGSAQTVALSKLPLTAQQTLLATVITLDGNQLTLQLPGTANGAPLRVTVDSQQLQLAQGNANNPGLRLADLRPGSTLQLTALSNGKNAQFAVSLAPDTTAQTVIDTLQRLLPVQRSTTPLLQQLTQLAPQLQHDSSVAATLKQLAQTILSSIPNRSALAEPTQLRQQVDQSGVFLEAKLAALLADETGSVLSDDLKLKLVKLVQLLSAEHSSAPPSNNADALQETLQKTQSALARITVDQVQSLPRDDSPKQVWALELPFFHDQRPDSVRIEIEQDKHPAHPDSTEKNWAVSITITPPNLATIQCKISYYAGAVHTRFWSQAPATVNTINQHIDTLRQQFEQKGLTPGFMEAQTGKPTKTETSPTPLPRLFNAHA